MKETEKLLAELESTLKNRPYEEALDAVYALITRWRLQYPQRHEEPLKG